MIYPFSAAAKELFSKARETAIYSGFNYISSVHFFIADCESKRATSIFKFAFRDDKEFEKFKKDYKGPDTGSLDLSDRNLPLTKEAEVVLKLAEQERILHRQDLIYPSTVFLSALKSSDSALSGLFKNIHNPYAGLVKYYTDLGVLKPLGDSASF